MKISIRLMRSPELIVGSHVDSRFGVSVAFFRMGTFERRRGSLMTNVSNAAWTAKGIERDQMSPVANPAKAMGVSLPDGHRNETDCDGEEKCDICRKSIYKDIYFPNEECLIFHFEKARTACVGR